MPVQAQQLLELQALDAEIGRLTRRTQQLDASLGSQVHVKAAELAMRGAEQALHQRQRAQREAEMELATVEARIKDHEQTLYGGRAGPRELQALQRDIEHDRLRKGELEEQALAAMEATEKAGQEMERIKQAAGRILGDRTAQQHRQAAERDQVRTELDRRSEQRAQLAARVDSGALSLYERLRQRTPDGTAVAEVVQGSCQGCRTNLPAIEVQRARRSETSVQCSACGRILYAPAG
jgi:hypothetical protein